LYEKKCPNCFKKSYSSNKEGQWICPHCKKDITKESAKPA